MPKQKNTFYKSQILQTQPLLSLTEMCTPNLNYGRAKIGNVAVEGTLISTYSVTAAAVGQNAII